MLPYRQRNAGAVIHTHSPKAVMATLLWPGKEFRCTHLEMIKVRWLVMATFHWSLHSIFLTAVYSSFWQGIYSHTLQRYLRYDEELIVPIIENTPFEKDLEDRMNQTMQEYPGTTAILVRRHGIYVWGDTWQKVKTQWAFSFNNIWHRAASGFLIYFSFKFSLWFQNRMLRLFVRHRMRNAQMRFRSKRSTERCRWLRVHWWQQALRMRTAVNYYLMKPKHQTSPIKQRNI